MLKKLIMFAITSGLAKKAWDRYQQKNAYAASGGTGSRRSATGKPVVKAKADESRPDAS
ncbi:MAG TPA: hypothetical protein VEA35_15695 [Ramlibacter sp.]|nr:hypothetical protein [Ramlibacter sp.]